MATFLSTFMWCVLAHGIASAEEKYPSPIRSWQNGVFQGNPIYSPVGPFLNYTIIFRSNDGFTYPPNFFMIESSKDAFSNTSIPGSYQQWTLLGTELSYCGLLTFNRGVSYEIAKPQFLYQPQLSSEYEVYFCADPRGGGCDTFWWQWKYFNDSGKLLWNNTVGGVTYRSKQMQKNLLINTICTLMYRGFLHLF